MRTAEFELHQAGIRVAAASGPLESAWASIVHYAMVYGQDGEVEAYEVIKGPSGRRKLLRRSLGYFDDRD